jgi:hypothetical protein
MIALNTEARTAPAVRAEVAASRGSVAALAQRYGIKDEMENHGGKSV